MKSCCSDLLYNKMGRLVGKKKKQQKQLVNYNILIFRYVHAYMFLVTSHIIDQ